MSILFREFLSLDSEGFVRLAYRITLGRDADATGFDNYVSRLLLGVGRIALLYDLSISAEARTGLGAYSDLSNLDDDAFVEALYIRMVKRRADPVGKQHYLQAIGGASGRRGAIKEMEASEEFAARNPQLLSFQLQLQQVLLFERRRRLWWRAWTSSSRGDPSSNRLHEAFLNVREKRI